MKKIILSAALLMAAATLSFAGTPKGETKEAKTETPTEAKTEAGTSRLWYVVTYNATYPNGAILSSSDLYDQGEISEIDSPCNPGTVKDCLRGFTTAPPSFPSQLAGDEVIQKP
jgi:hypothetical protein